MYILPNTSIETIEQKGTAEQKATAVYFDVNGNGKIDRTEADSFNYAKITKTEDELTIQHQNGYIDTFENLRTRKPDSYYKSGSIPIAVIDLYNEECPNTFHGTAVSNTLKKYNKELSLTEIDCSPQRCWSKFQKNFAKFADRHLKIATFLSDKKLFPSFILGHKEHKSDLAAFQEIKTRIDNGEKFKAVNFSSSINTTYEAINKLVEKELGITITPDNIKENLGKIRAFLEQNPNKKIEWENEKVKVKKYLDIIKAMESLNIPIYMAGEYKTGANREIEQFNILALAKNSIIIDAGLIQADGSIIHDKIISHSSLSIDENGKRKIEDAMFYSEDKINRGCTSYATPMALAKDFLPK